jgi:hypothetical protein
MLYNVCKTESIIQNHECVEGAFIFGYATVAACIYSNRCPVAAYDSMRTPNNRILAFVLALISLLLALSVIQAAQAGVWVTNSPMAIARYDHTATMLPNGKVLVAGGFGLSSAELYNPATRAWTMTGPMAVNRGLHTATLLPNGKVLVAGGLSSSGIGNQSSNGAELYDPATGTWKVTGPLATARYSHTATLLPNGKVLVTGGIKDGSVVSNAELYDPSTGTWSAAGVMTSPRSQHSASLLPNGKVLLAGGINLSSAELFDPANGTWTPTGAMISARRLHTATLLPNGKVLAAGGINSSSSSASSAETYDAATGTWTAVGAMATGRYSFTATLLPNGKVIVAGGGVATSTFTSSTELYQADTGTWVAGGVMKITRAEHTATLLTNGNLLIAGGRTRTGNTIDGVSSTELYVKAAGTVILSNLAQTYDDTAKSVSVTTAPPGLTVIVTYNGSTNAPINAGSYTVIGTINDLDYQGSATNTLVVGKASGLVNLGNLVQTYNGASKSVSVTTAPLGLTVALTYNGSSAVPINAGSYTVIGTINDLNYQGSVTNLFVVVKATGTVNLGDLVQTYDGTAKSVHFTTTPLGLTVDVTYNGSASSPTNPGNYTVVGTINDLNYSGGTTNTFLVGIWPVIQSQPASRTNNLGSTATFIVVADGTPPLFYKWLKDGIICSIVNSPILTLTNIQKSDEGLYSVAISNAFGSVVSADARLTVNRPPIADATATLRLVFSVNSSNAAVVLDASRSYDPDGDPLQYTWFTSSSTNALTNGVVAVVILPVGTNSITLTVNDSLATDCQTITVEVITPAQAISRLIDAAAEATTKQSLLATLRAALAAVNRSNPTAAINQLQAFQHQVSAQLGSIDPLTARALIDEAQGIIDTMTGDITKPGKVKITIKSNCRSHLNFSGVHGQVYIIEASLDLVNWEKIGVASNQTNADFIFDDDNAANAPARYYRVGVP